MNTLSTKGMLLAGAILTLAACLGTRAQVPGQTTGMLTTAGWLSDHLDDPSLVILHLGNKRSFDSGHIPGAVLVTASEILVDHEGALTHEIPDKEAMQELFRSWGVQHGSRIVITYRDDRSVPMAARLFVTLDYFGLGDQTALLQGGMKDWKDKGGRTTTDVAEIQETMIGVEPNEDLLIGGEELKEKLEEQQFKVIDARPREQYTGESRDHNSSRRGHIPGAVNIPYSTVLVKKNPHRFKSVRELHKLFDREGINPETDLAVYCGSGIWASTVYVAARLAGYRVRFYDGSFQEWGNDESYPVREGK